MRPIIEARGLAVRRGRRRVLFDVDMTLRPGEAVALFGPNAAGKSTLIRTLAGLLPALAGEIRLLDRELRFWSRAAVARVIALVASDDSSGSLLTVRERVALGRYPHRGPFRRLDADDDAAISHALERTEIGHLGHRRLGELSAGERQLAVLARGLAQEPQVLLLDEPAAHLDVRHQLHLFRALDEARSRGVAVLTVVHDLQRAAAWAERTVLLAGGRIAAEGTPRDVLLSAACSKAFGVSVRGHEVPGSPSLLYSFEENGR
ncbi:MAG: ABC transporter ATP-binding protein [Vicinamibacteria bacterium]|nr:ABC transporter ATP-binding protein [Vicinamibacteria bacterium]